MGPFRTKVPSHLIPVNPQNATSNDWVILLEAGTIIGPSSEKLRVARSTLERKIVKKYRFMRKACVSAWNKDPVFGVIGIQSGPRGKGPQWLPSSHGSRGWDAGGGDDCEDPSRLFCSWSADQGDLPRAWRIAQGSPQGHSVRGDRVPVRARDAAASKDGPVE